MEPNKFGRYTKRDVIENEYTITEEKLEGLYTYSELQKEFNVEWSKKERLQKTSIFYCSAKIRGCVPLYNPLDFIDEL